MPPKKAAVDPDGRSGLSAPEAPEEDSKAQKPDAATVRKLSSHPSTLIMVKEAIQALDSRKGVSSQAIQSYIKQKYPSVDPLRLKPLVRRALIKAQENGTLVRPANSSMSTGAQGKFRLAPKVKEAKPKEAKPKSENADPNVSKTKRKAKDGEKPAKAGATKTKDDESSKTKSSEKEKVLKKSTKKESKSTVAPVKRPKAKKIEKGSSAESSDLIKAPSTKPGKASKASPDPASAKVTGKRGKKTE